jgi:uncharacterized protein YciI
MKQYLVTGYDFHDDAALERRMNVRPDHINGVKALKQAGSYVIGGAILNEDGKMIGSTMIVQFESEDALNSWKENEVYITRKIWETVDIQPFKVAEV